MKINITSVDTFFDAVKWCEENLDKNNWVLSPITFPTERYEIEFADPVSATMFALKWS